MNFHVHPKGFWLWLKPTQESSELLIDLRNEVIIDNGTKAFPFHLTISKINLENLHETKLSYENRFVDLFNQIGQIKNNLNKIKDPNEISRY